MAEPVNSLLEFITGGDALLRAIFALIFVLVAHLGVKVLSHYLRREWAKEEGITKKGLEERYELIQYASYGLDSIAIILALLYLNTGVTGKIGQIFSASFPKIVSAVLFGVLGIIGINIFTKLSENFLESIDAASYFRDIGLSENTLSMMLAVTKGFLYVLLLQIILTQLGIGDTFIQEFINASSWALAFLAAGLIFFGFKDLFQNYAAGIYLKNSSHFRPGEELDLKDRKGTINNISLFSTNIDTKDGHIRILPNTEVMNSDIDIRKTKRDIETLDEIKNYFVAQHPAYCGPASAEMALEIFGYRESQEEIAEKSNCDKDEGVEREDLMETIEQLTTEDIKTAWVPYNKITDLADEFKTWFNNGALIIPNFYKEEIFPEADIGHYVLSIGVEEDDILVLDPSPDSGGVYYIDKGKLLGAMAEFDHEQGYIVLAPEGTTAYWRIEKDLIYSDKNYYDQISKALETRLRKLLRQGRIVKDVTPERVEEYIEKWREEEKITRLWKPQGVKDDSEADESSDSQ